MGDDWEDGEAAIPVTAERTDSIGCAKTSSSSGETSAAAATAKTTVTGDDDSSVGRKKGTKRRKEKKTSKSGVGKNGSVSAASLAKSGAESR